MVLVCYILVAVGVAAACCILVARACCKLVWIGLDRQSVSQVACILLWAYFDSYWASWWLGVGACKLLAFGAHHIWVVGNWAAVVWAFGGHMWASWVHSLASWVDRLAWVWI